MTDTLPGLILESTWALVLGYLLNLRFAALNRRLETKASEQLDALRSERTKAEAEHRVRFTRLHEQRAKVISGTYARLDRFHREVRNMVQVVSSSVDRPAGWDAAVKAYRELSAYWYERAIWLDVATNDAIRPVVDLLLEPIARLAVTKDRNWNDLVRAVEEARIIVDETVPAARQVMEDKMRKVLAASGSS